ncbi:MerR family transcriptional regulator [Halothermothrix orenii]|uniref:Putative transcriptional regulator, MerR family n=1 Tax=Halothermothrix orenii (strain H 168 / OCM 544 / DSM 9562) TaxID=373903 RepID=B8CX29_HALOH|nr:MerR family transcriptional regulator [Halothermothrix orenii]ACL69848.1 putative transcriptional regulator, MerR family [Halothermothrix orenii H 168]
MEKKDYTTSEAAEILNVAPSTLRYWESELGNYLKIPRDKNGYRKFTPDNIETLKKIKEYLYERKFSIKQVREILNLEESKQDVAATLVGETDERVSSLVSILIDKIDGVENGIKELKEGQQNLKTEYLQAIKLLNITFERRDRELIKEIRKRLDQRKEENNKNLLKRLLPWSDK